MEIRLHFKNHFQKGEVILRGQGVKDSRARVKMIEKEIHIEKFLTLGTVFYKDIL